MGAGYNRYQYVELSLAALNECPWNSMEYLVCTCRYYSSRQRWERLYLLKNS